ncbi:MAG: haloalkane dehalogenase [Planctomycetota bacterium]
MLLFTAGCLQVMPALAPKAKQVETPIGDAFAYPSRYVEVHGSTMHYVEAGQGPVVLLLHGNPTSSYLWRNVIPHLRDRYRVIAPDLIGMGKSDQPDLAYRFADHTHYIDGFIEAMELEDVALVLHDWGGAIGLDYAARNERNVRAVAVMEAVIKPMSLEDDGDFATRYLFGRFRDPEDGHQIIAEDNYFVEKLLPMMTGRKLTEAEMEAYRAPYPTVKSRQPVAQWPREIPFDGEPADNHQRIGDNYAWLQNAREVPLLILHAEPA